MGTVVHLVAAPEMARLIVWQEVMHQSGDHEVWSPPGPDLDHVEAAGAAVVRIPLTRRPSLWQDPLSLAGLVVRLGRRRPTVLHTYGPKAGLLGQIAARLTGVRHRIHSCRGLLYVPGLAAWRAAMYRLVDRLTSRLADRVLFVSSADRETLVGGGLCPPSKARVTGNGIDLRVFRFEREPASRAAAKVALGYRSDEVIVLTVGRYTREKGYLDLAAAIPMLRGSTGRVRFLWVAPVMSGERPLPDEIAEAPALRGVVRRLGRQEDMTRVYRAADLLVHPSHREGVPRVLMEAAACGVPILATEIPGCREVVRFGVTAMGFPPRSPQELAAALDAMLAAPESWGPLAEAARAEVVDRMDVVAVAGRVRDVYRELGAVDDRTDPTRPLARLA